jgi:hypothetical protein
MGTVCADTLIKLYCMKHFYFALIDVEIKVI